MLKARILTAATLLAGFLAALFYLPRAGWIGVVALALSVAAWEWAGLSGLRLAGRAAYAVIVTVAATWVGWDTSAIPGSAFGRSWLYVSAGVFWVVLAPLWLWERPAFKFPVMPLAAGLVVLVPTAAAMVELRDASPVLLLGTMGIAWVSDIAAYFAGHRFGKHKFAPSISPGKTWEGVFGALAAVTAYAIGWLIVGGGPQPEALRTGTPGSLWFVILLLGFAVAGIAGDLLESQMKRHAGVKDSGRLLPGHGGVLDRIDALLPVLPLAALAFLK